MMKLIGSRAGKGSGAFQSSTSTSKTLDESGFSPPSSDCDVPRNNKNDFESSNYSASGFDYADGNDNNDESTTGRPDDEELGQVDELEERKKIVEQVLARREQRTVCSLKILLFLVLAASATAVALLTYYFTSQWETKQFVVQFGEDSNKVMQSIGTSLDLTLEGLDALTVSMVSSAKATNQVWPYVTIPDFAVKAEKIRILSKAVYLNVYALVPAEERSMWEDYAAFKGRGWVEETLNVFEKDGTFDDVFDDLNLTYSVDDVTYWDVIHDYDEWEKDEDEQGTVGLDPSDPGPFMPMWQTTPLVPVDPPYNWDLLSVPYNDTTISAINEAKPRVSITEPYLIAFENDTETIQENIDEAEWVSAYVTTGEDPMAPMADIYYPVRCSFGSVVVKTTFPNTLLAVDH